MSNNLDNSPTDVKANCPVEKSNRTGFNLRMAQQKKIRDLVLEGLRDTGMSMAELARRSGVPYDTINKLKSRDGASTSAENAAALTRALGVGEALPPEETLVPIYDVQASAGHGALIDSETVVDRLAFPPGYLAHITSTNPRHLAIIGVKGDSMLPTLSHDDIVMVDMTKTNIAYDGMFVLRYGDALHVKRVSRGSSPDMVRIISANPDYPAVEYSAEDVTPIGKVVWYGKKV
jgi:phage repressor protein C with HTH and peptisase S24 domain